MKIVDENKYAPDEWITLACKGGTGDLDRKLEWLFDTPSMSLTEGAESFTDWPPKADSILSAYGAKPGTRPLFVKLTFVFVCFVVLLVSLALARTADSLPTVDICFL